MKKLFLLSIFLLLSSCNYAYAQQAGPMPEKTVTVSQQFLDDATRSFSEVVALRASQAALQAELETNKSLRAKEEAYNAALLQAEVLLLSSEKRNRSFFEKLGRYFSEALRAATNPRDLLTIALLIKTARDLAK